MAFCKSQSVSTDRGAWANSTAYSVGDGVTFTGLDSIASQGIRFRCIQAHTSQTGVIEPTLDPADAYWRPSHALSALGWFNTIVSMLKSAAFMGSGNNWAEAYRYDARTHTGTYTSQGFAQPMKRLIIVLRSPDVGLIAGRYYTLQYSEATNAIVTRNLRLGCALAWSASPGGNSHTFVGAWATSTGYNVGDVVTRATSPAPTHSICITAHTSSSGNQPGTTGGLAYWHDLSLAVLSYATDFGAEWHYHNDPSFSGWAASPMHTNLRRGPLFKLWDGGTGNIPFALIANAHRAMWVVQSDTFWTFGHAGSLLRFGTPAENPCPIFLLGNARWQDSANSFPGSNLAYSDTSLMNYPLAAKIQDGTWAVVYSNRGYGLTRSLTWLPIEDVSLFFLGGNHRGAAPWRCAPFNHADENWLNQNPAGHYSLHDALMICTSTGSDRGFHGSLDGVYWLPHQGQASGNLVTVNGVDHLVVENVYRGAGGGFMALKLA